MLFFNAGSMLIIKTSCLRLKKFWTGTDKIKPQTATGESRKDGKDDEKSPEPGQKGNAEE